MANYVDSSEISYLSNLTMDNSRSVEVIFSSLLMEVQENLILNYLKL